QIERFIKNKRLFIGPWYVSPDEYLISPESHIRNLLAGGKICRALGGKMLVGYLPDTFGHIGQMPQILRGFQIDNACLWRGLDDHPCELEWQAPDGSRILLSYLRDSYSNAASLVTSDPEKFSSQVDDLVQSLGPYARSDQVLLMYGTDHMEPSPDLSKAVAYYQANDELYELLISNLPNYFTSVQASLASQSAKLQIMKGELRSSKHSPLLPNVLSTRIWLKQHNFTCENELLMWVEPFATWSQLLEYPQKQTAAVNAFRSGSSIVDQQPVIAYAWKLLMQCHPHDSICGTSIDQVHQEMRARFDQVDQINHELVRQGLFSISEHIDTQSSSPPNISDGSAKMSAVIVVFNASDSLQTGLVQQKLMLEDHLGSFELLDSEGNPVVYEQAGMGSKELISMKLDRKAMKQAMNMIHEGNVAGLVIRDFKLTKQDGSALVQATLSDHAQVDNNKLKYGMGQMEAMLADPGVHEYIIQAYSDPEIEITLVARDVPPHGYRCYYLKGVATHEGNSPEPPKLNPIASRLIPIAGKLAQSPFFSRLLSGSEQKPTNKPQKMENEYFIVEAKPGDKGLVITDKRTGQILVDSNQLIDGGDSGDLYNYCPPQQDDVFTARIKSVMVDEYRTKQQLIVGYELQIPKELTRNRSKRGKVRVSVLITSTFQLVPGVPRIDIHTEIDNPAHDHRLRVHFPAPFHAEHAFHDGHFEIVQRPIGITTYDESREEPPRAEVPQCQFTAISSGGHSIMLANRGLPEVEVFINDKGNAEIAMTLMRCIGWLSRDDLTTRKGHAGPMGVATPEAQLDGRYAFDYSVIPGDGQWRTSVKHAYAFNTPFKAITTSFHIGNLLNTSSLVESSNPDFVITAIKMAEDGCGFIVRGYNNLPVSLNTTLRLFRTFKQVHLSQMDEEPLNPIPMSTQGLVALQVEAHKIITLRFVD
ncbi:MAG: hypothetical protein FIA98_01540, partial [Anaerolineae bacterium]|nr:hypothetical protein [Anaerolineae bacterium]